MDDDYSFYRPRGVALKYEFDESVQSDNAAKKQRIIHTCLEPKGYIRNSLISILGLKFCCRIKVTKLFVQLMEDLEKVKQENMASLLESYRVKHIEINMRVNQKNHVLYSPDDIVYKAGTQGGVNISVDSSSKIIHKSL